MIKKQKARKVLDGYITKWRVKLRNAQTEEDRLRAQYYLKAFQSIRFALLAELMEPEEGSQVELST